MNEVIICGPRFDIPIIKNAIKNGDNSSETKKYTIEDLPVDMDYIEIMRPSAKKVREFFKEIAEELNKTIW